jgi:hypothetical protein
VDEPDPVEMLSEKAASSFLSTKGDRAVVWGHGGKDMVLSARARMMLLVIVASMAGSLGATRFGQWITGSKVYGRDTRSPVQRASDFAAGLNVSAQDVARKGLKVGPFDTLRAVSHDNHVEVTYVASDPAIFAALKNAGEQMRMERTFHYCNRNADVKHGVVIHDITVNADASDRIDFTVDAASCDSLPKPQLADTGTLAGLAEAAAKAENEDSAQKAPDGPVRLEGAIAHEGIVDERFTVQDASIKDKMLANRDYFIGLNEGAICAKYRNAILQGLTFHQAYVSPDDKPVLDLTIDKFSC